MEGWNDFYRLIGGTAGTLIGLIFVVVTLGMDHARKGDEIRTRLYVAPTLVYFTTLLIVSLAMVAPLSPAMRAFILGAVGCVGVFYAANIALTSRRRTDLDEKELLWNVLLPLLAYVLITAAAAGWAFRASFAPAIGAVAAVLLLVTALRNSWMVTLAIGDRGPKKK